MITSRYILSNINKAMFNNQKVLILINDYQRNSDLLQLLAKQGFINGFEIRGKYIFIHLRQMYWMRFTAYEKSFLNISVPVRKRNSKSISAKNWDKLVNLTGHAAYFVMSTDKGIIDSYSNNTHTGGIPLFKVL